LRDLPPGPYLIVGLARSGVAAALTLRARGEKVIGLDVGSPAGLDGLASAGVELHLEDPGVALLERVKTVVKSPGVPAGAPVIQRARALEMLVMGELELAWRLLPNDFIAVTGTNGKTTTVELIGHIHREAGLPVAVAGNVGVALSGLVGTIEDDVTIVCEASSFQLEDALAFSPEVAVLLNLTPDHLDRHGTIDAYLQAKLRMFSHQSADDVAIVPLDFQPERLPGARRRLTVDLERYLEYAAEQASPLEPAHLELEFGFEQEGLPPLDLGEGVLLRGRIDRVDVAGEAAVVYDYKGRAAPPGAKWTENGAFQVALYMRAVERLLGHTPVGGFYQPLAGRDIKARGVLDGDSGVELDCVRTDRLDHDELQELVERCVAVARDAAGEARSGALEPRPDTCAYNGGCAYPTICRCER